MCFTHYGLEQPDVPASIIHFTTNSKVKEPVSKQMSDAERASEQFEAGELVSGIVLNHSAFPNNDNNKNNEEDPPKRYGAFNQKPHPCQPPRPPCQQMCGCFLSKINCVSGEGSNSYLSKGRFSTTMGSQGEQLNLRTGCA